MRALNVRSFSFFSRCAAARAHRGFAAPLLLAPLLAAAVSLAGCDPFAPDLGDEPFRCGDNDACPDGYSCEPTADIPGGVCVAESGGSTGGDGDSTGDGDGDGDSSLCSDGGLEPNDSVTSAVITSIPDQQLQYQAVGLTVCPPGDTDLFRFRVAVANQNIRAEIATDRGQGELAAEITSEQGQTLATGSYNAASTQLTVELQNAAIDTYLLKISGTTTEVENTYDVDLQLSGP